MIKYIVGDIFQSPAQVIVNTVNTVGVMGKGLALSFKERYPDMFDAYREVCEKHELQIGKLMLWNAPDHEILLFPTKENWRSPSKLEYIDKGLKKFVQTYAEKNINSVAFPRLGCGNGELDWNEVKPLMERYLKDLPIDVYIYIGVENANPPESKTPHKTIEWMKEHARDMSFNGVKEDIMHTTAIIPYSFISDDTDYKASWKGKGLTFTPSHGQDILVSENLVFETWDNIRNQGIFEDSDEQSVHLVYLLLESLGYLSKIKIKKNKSVDLISGYQVNEGSGRIYALQGA